MKHLLYCSFVLLFLASCNDGLVLPETEDPTLQQPNPDINPNDEVVHFSDRVLDDQGNGLQNVQVSIYAENLRYSDVTNEQGEYYITVPLDQLPAEGYISLSIIKKDYKPKNVTYPAPLTANTIYDSNEESLSLSGCPTCLSVGGYKSSELFHLGDDAYNGSANSQFQKSTDGVEMVFELEGSSNYSKLRLSFEAKGLQISSFDVGSSIQFSSGEEMVAESFIEQDSEEDGGYSSYSFVVDNTSAITSLKVMSRNHGTEGSDYDDWEFTCLYVEGI